MTHRPLFRVAALGAYNFTTGLLGALVMLRLLGFPAKPAAVPTSAPASTIATRSFAEVAGPPVPAHVHQKQIDGRNQIIASLDRYRRTAERNLAALQAVHDVATGEAERLVEDALLDANPSEWDAMSADAELRIQQAERIAKQMIQTEEELTAATLALEVMRW